MLRKILNLSLFLLMFFYIGNSEVYSQYGEDDWGDDDWWDDPWNNDNGYDPDDTYLTYDEWMDFFDTNGDGVIDDNDNILDEVVVTGSSGGSGDGDGPGSNDNNDPGDDGYGDDDYGDDYGDDGNDVPQDPSYIDASFNQTISIPISPIINLPLRVKVEPLNHIIIAPIVPLVIEFPIPELSGILNAYNSSSSSLTVSDVQTEALSNLENGTPLSIEVQAFLDVLQNLIINAYVDEVNDSDTVIEFEDCPVGDCYCSSDCGGCDMNFVCNEGEILVDCECIIDITDPCANKDLINKVLTPQVQSLMDARNQNLIDWSTGLTSNVSSFELQTIDNGFGDNINLDRYGLTINSLPDGYTAFTLFDEIRKSFGDIVTGGDIPILTDVIFEPYASQDGILWNSNNPTGAAMDFSNIFDTSTVYCVDYNNDEMNWTFATVSSVDHLGHFVAGYRQFGLEPNASGGYSFYIRGADRLGGILDQVANAGDYDMLYREAADATWKNVMKTLQSYISSKPGAEVLNFEKNKAYGNRHLYVPGGCN